MKSFSATTLAQALPAEKSWISVFADLFKARLTALVLVTTAMGFYLGTPAPDYVHLLHAVFGMGLVASGGAALNEWLEREHDAKMRRTCERPLPSGRLQPPLVLWLGWVLALLGIAYLAVLTNPLTGTLAAITLCIYLFVYTPLKRVTWLNTLVGAIPGALPPLIGWTAARGQIDAAGVSLFLIQALWQVPHFMAIAWIYRNEYARAGFQMLPVLDPDGVRTSRQALLFSIALLFSSLVPWFLGVAGPVYLAAAVLLGLAFVGSAIRFSLQLSIPFARQLFFASILYLPVLLAVLVLDKVKG